MDMSNPEKFLSFLSEEEAIKSLHSIEYYPSHRALMKLASQIQDDSSNDGLLALACATYGWMPTILKKWDMENFRISNPVSKIRAMESYDTALNFLDEMDETAPINSSWVGTSKLLHFLNPSIFPIWDSRVAIHFGLKWPHQINSKASYKKYFEFVHYTLGKRPSFISAVQRQIEDEHGYRPTEVRCLELMLFEAKP